MQTYFHNYAKWRRGFAAQKVLHNQHCALLMPNYLCHFSTSSYCSIFYTLKCFSIWNYIFVCWLHSGHVSPSASPTAPRPAPVACPALQPRLQPDQVLWGWDHLRTDRGLLDDRGVVVVVSSVKYTRQRHQLPAGAQRHSLSHQPSIPDIPQLEQVQW